MSIEILKDARKYLVDYLKGKPNLNETRHPWRKDWQFPVLHSLRVESYALQILARDNPPISEKEITLLRLAAILHDIGRLEKREQHAQLGAEIVRSWLTNDPNKTLNSVEMELVIGMIATHSDKLCQEQDYFRAVLKDADTLDEIGVMSIFMTNNWLDSHSPFFFYNLRQRLIDIEIPFCDKQQKVLNTSGARKILADKKVFIENFIVQLSNELQMDPQIEEILPGLSLNFSSHPDMPSQKDFSAA